jgi:hypothetical protein
MVSTDMWTYRETTWSTTNLDGFEVEATDGGIGKVDEATNDVGGSYIVVDTGPWIFGKKVLLPAGVIETVDLDEQKVYVNRTKDEIKNSPEFDEANYRDRTYRDRVGTYYGRGGTTGRDIL